MNTTTLTAEPGDRPLCLTQAQVSESWEATKLTMADFRRRIRRKITKTYTDEVFGGERTITVEPTDEQKENRCRNLYRDVLKENASDTAPIEWMLRRMAIRVQLDTARLIVERDLGIAQRRGALRVVDGAAMEGDA